MELSVSDKQENHAVQKTAEYATHARNEIRTLGQRRTLLLLVGVWVISVFYVTINLNRGWIPHDEGTYAQSAERVLGGELPHRDFDELYTGGLSFLNALAFSVLGTKLISLRIVLLLFFLAWVPALFYIATRFTSSIAAGAVTLLAVAWGIPNYSAAAPSWYNLSFALFGTVAIFRYLETRRHQWVFLAGLCGGLSILVKITGLYFVAAALLFFVFHEQCQANKAGKQSTSNRERIYSLSLTVSLLAFLAILCVMIRNLPGAPYIVHFVLPGAALVLFLLWVEFQNPPGNSAQRFAPLLRLLAPFSLGVLLPIAAYLIPYIKSGSLAALVRGVFILPQLHMVFTLVKPSNFSAMPATLLLTALIVLGMYLQGAVRQIYGAIVAVACVGALIASGHDQAVYRFVWSSLSFSIPVVVLSGVALLRSKGNDGESSGLFGEQFFLLLALTAVWSMIEIPFSAPIYFCFVAPVLMVTVLALFSSIGKPPRFIFGVLLCFYLLFAVLRTTPGFIHQLGYTYHGDEQTTALTLPRAGGLRIEADDAQLYERLIPLIQEHASGRYAYAAPDCPEVYFLSGLRNPTRTIFDFSDNPVGRTASILSAIERNQVNVVAILTKPPFSQPLAPDLHAELRKRFPNSETVERFEVRWR
jgi:hypothetical protein